MRRVIYADTFVDDADRIAADIESRSGIRSADAFRDELNWFCNIVASQPGVGKQDHGYDTTLYGVPHDVNWIFFQSDDAEARFVHVVHSRREKRSVRLRTSYDLAIPMELDFPNDDSVEIDGRRSVTARKLSEHYGFSAKQIARLALESKVEGQFLGRLWYVSERSLNEYIDDRLRS